MLFVTSVLAAAISFHNTVARYTFALGRERVFPVALGSTGRRSGAPIGGSILQSLIGLVVIVLFIVFNLDPVLQLFYYGGNGGGFGILLLVTLTSLAVVVLLRPRPARRERARPGHRTGDRLPSCSHDRLLRRGRLQLICSASRLRTPGRMDHPGAVSRPSACWASSTR